MTEKTRTPAPVADIDRYMLLVLGMHRSGTSALSGVLHHLGCALPKTPMDISAHNSKGYFESKAIFRMNDTLLSEAGSNWRDWRPMNPDWFASPVGQSYQARARDLLADEFEDAPLCVFKDPRNCRMVPFWRETAAQMGMKTLPVLIHRNPFEVAQSLQERDKIDIPEGLAIWLRHVLDAEIGTRGTPRFLLSYDQLLQNWPAQVNRMQKTLDIIFPRFDERASSQIDEFLSKPMRHFNELPEKLSENRTLSFWIRETYRILERWTQKAEVKADYATLDQIREGFDAAAPLFSQLVGPESHLAKRLNARIGTLETQNADTSKENAELRNRLHEELGKERSKTATMKAELAESQSQAAKHQSAAAAAQQMLAATEEKLEHSDADLQTLSDKLSQTESALAQRRLEAEEATQAAAQSDQERQQAEAELAQHKREAEEATRAAAQSDQARQQAEAELAQRKREAEEATRAAAQSDQARQKAEAELAGHKREAEEATQAAAQSDQERQKAEADLVLAQDALEALRKDYDRQADILAKNGKQLQQREAAIFEKMAAFERLSTTNLSQTNELSTLAKLLQEAETAVAEKAEKAAQSDAERGALQKRVQQLENEVVAFSNSTFWRMTKPLRVLVDTLRGNR